LFHYLHVAEIYAGWEFHSTIIKHRQSHCEISSIDVRRQVAQIGLCERLKRLPRKTVETDLFTRSRGQRMRVLGVVLIVLGILGFAIGGITFTRERTLAEVGPLEVQAEERETFPIAPLAAGAALVAGIVLVVLGSRRSP
jgi:hypothetical protein